MACLHHKNNLGLASVTDITRQGAETHAWERNKKQALSFFQHAFRKAQTRTRNHTSDVSVGRLLALKYLCSYWS